jgi:DNA-binding response OmpR family regulator
MLGSVRALLIDDDARLAALTAEYLGRNEIETTIAPDGEQGLSALARGAFDVVLLDLMLPGVDGLEICRRIRAGAHSAVPIVMLTAKGDDVDRIVGLELGADDYLPKPFNPRELLARVRAVLRRAAPPAATGARVRVGEIELDFGAREVTARGERVVLTHYEFELLACLARAAGRVLSRDHLLEALRGVEYDSIDRSIDVHISKLRQKLEENPKDPRLIKTIRGVGYTMARDA